MEKELTYAISANNTVPSEELKINLERCATEYLAAVEEMLNKDTATERKNKV